MIIYPQFNKFILLNAGDDLTADTMPWISCGLHDPHWHRTTRQGNAQRQTGKATSCNDDLFNYPILLRVRDEISHPSARV